MSNHQSPFKHSSVEGTSDNLHHPSNPLIESRRQEAIATLKLVKESILINNFVSLGMVPVLGIIKNMSYLVCKHCGEPTYIFGSGGGEQIAAELQAPLLGKIPIEPHICTAGDVGQPMPIVEPSSLVAQVFMEIAKALNTTFSSRNSIALQ